MKTTNKKTIYRTIKLIFVIIAMLIIAINVIQLTYVTYQNHRIYDSKIINATMIIGNQVGLAGDTDVLNFGIVPPGAASKKTITLYHEYKEPLEIRVIYEGSITPYLTPIEPFILEPKNETSIAIIATALTYGPAKYNGTVTILYLKT